MIKYEKKIMYHMLCETVRERIREDNIMCHNKNCITLWYRSIFVILFFLKVLTVYLNLTFIVSIIPLCL